jgi:hypothetical protein
VIGLPEDYFFEDFVALRIAPCRNMEK